MSKFVDVMDLIGKPITGWHMVRASTGIIIAHKIISTLPGAIAKPMLSTVEYEAKRKQMLQWLSEHTIGEWTIINFLDPNDAKMVVGFKSVEDAILFKLTWA
jgi:hypothetical protein